MVQELNMLEQAAASLSELQAFDPNSLVQDKRLGEAAFNSAVEPAGRLIQFFKLLPLNALDQFPETELTSIKRICDTILGIFSDILQFDLNLGDNKQRSSTLTEQLRAQYQSVFSQMFSFIAYSTARTVDFDSLASRGRDAINAFTTEKDNLLGSIKTASEDAIKIVEAIRGEAAEVGVTKMARYFADEAKEHEKAAGKWLYASAIAVVIVSVYAVSTLFLFQWFPAHTSFESAQIITSKLLVFGVLVYGLFQCVRSYSAHRHNQVTNKHRQNALMTYKTLAEAGNSPELRDAVLQHAAAAIYAPNDSGYLKAEERGYGAQGLLALLPRMPGASSGPGQP